MRVDGDIVYFQLQAKYEKQEIHKQYRGWFVHNDCEGSFHWDLRSKKLLSITDFFNKYPKFNGCPGTSPTANGYLWQKYGIHGVTTLKAAKHWLKKAKGYHAWRLTQRGYHSMNDFEPLSKKEQDKARCEFRIVRVTKSQKTEAYNEPTHSDCYSPA